MGSFIRIGPGIEEGEPSSCGGAPMGVVLGGRKILSPKCALRPQNLQYFLTSVPANIEILYVRTEAGHQ